MTNEMNDNKYTEKKTSWILVSTIAIAFILALVAVLTSHALLGVLAIITFVFFAAIIGPDDLPDEVKDFNKDTIGYIVFGIFFLFFSIFVGIIKLAVVCL